MRKPRDIDAELKALADKARDLKARKISQLGELVIATGADTLDMDVLAGVLASAVQTRAGPSREDWRRRGAAFFQQRSRARPPEPAGGDGES